MTDAARYVTLSGPNTALRIDLPILGRLVAGSADHCEVQLRPDYPRELVHIVLDPGIGITVVQGTAEITRANQRKKTSVPAGKMVDLELGDIFRIGELELSFAAGAVAPCPHHLWSKTHLVSALQERLTSDKRWVAACLEVTGMNADRVGEVAFGELADHDLIGTLGPNQYGLVLEGREARARAALRRIAQNLKSEAETVRVGVAPADNHLGIGMLEAAQARLSGGPDTGTFDALLESSEPKMQAVLQNLNQVAESSTPVLLLGETGAGKDVLARAIHERSDRSAGPLVRVNCVGLTDAFAAGQERALLGRAAGGTLLLDEVSGLSARAQIELGYLLEAEDSGSDVRFIATSNHDLQAAVRAGDFRKDLYFRLGRVILEVPPLRERKTDLAALAEHLLADASREAGRSPLRFSRSALAQLELHDWPGNIRELRNAIDRAILHTQDDSIRVEDLPSTVGHGGQPSVSAPPSAGTEAPTNLREEMAALERRRILEALDAYPTQTEAAKALGIPLRTFLNRLDALDIPRARKKD